MIDRNKKVRRNFHGVFSLILLLASVVMALSYILILSLGWGLAYLGIIMLANPIVLYAYCTKCLCREDACSHVFPGRLTRLLPARKQGPYTFSDYFWTGICLMVLFAFPIPWLWQSKMVLFGYWLLLIIGLAEILFLVCRTCRNENCPVCSLSEQNTPKDIF
jgi:hypothetical protein